MKFSKVFLLIPIVFCLGLGLIGCSEDDGGTSAPALDAPVDLIATATSSTEITLEWSNTAALLYAFLIQRAEGDGEWVQIADIQDDSENPSYDDEGLTEGTMYRYRIQNYTPTAESAFSEAASATTTPNAPTGLTAERASGSEIDIAWTDNSEVETNYEIQRSLNAASGWETITTLGADAVALHDSNLEQNTRYYYRVRAKMGEIVSEWSRTANAVTTVFTPAAPTNLTSEVLSHEEVMLRWHDNSYNEDGFVIQWSPNGEDTWTHVDSLGDNSSSRRAYSVDGLLAETMYYFRIHAFNEHGNSPYTNITSAQTDPGPPPVPENFEGDTPDYEQVILAWSYPYDEELGFILQKKAVDDVFWEHLDSLAADILVLTDNDVNPSGRYNYRIRAWNEQGPSAWTSAIEVVVPEGPPLTPQNCRAEATGLNSIAVRWIDRSTNEDGFMVERKNPGAERFNTIGVTNPSTGVFRDEGLEPETTYEYRVKAYREVDGESWESGYSNVAEGTTWGPVVLTEGFEGYDLNAPPPENSGWQISLNGGGPGQGNVLITDERAAAGGTKSAKLLDPRGDRTNSIVMIRDHRPVIKNTTEFKIFIPSFGDAFTLRGGDQSGNIAWEIYFANIQEAGDIMAVRNDDQLVYNSNFDIPSGEWITIRLECDSESDLYSVFLNNELYVENSQYDMRNPTSSLAAFVVVCFSGSDDADSVWPELFVDDIHIEQSDLPAGTISVEPQSDRYRTGNLLNTEFKGNLIQAR